MSFDVLIGLILYYILKLIFDSISSYVVNNFKYPVK